MSRAFWRYVGLQLPQVALVAAVALWLGERLEWPAWGAWAVIGAWVTKEAALYPVLRRSLSGLPGRGGADELRGASAQVREALEPEGWVEVCGELWRARCAPDVAPLHRGAVVQVREVRDLVLWVDPPGEAAGDGSRKAVHRS